MGCGRDAVAELEKVVPRLHPSRLATAAVIIATLATYYSKSGEPQRGLALLSKLSLDATRATDVSLICLSARCACRAAAGHLEGARRDRDAIAEADPRHPTLARADDALASASCDAHTLLADRRGL